MPSDTSPPSSSRGTAAANELLILCKDTLIRARRILEGRELPVEQETVSTVERIVLAANELASVVERRLYSDPGDANPTPEQYRFAGGR
jgi:hypothetical protein